MGDPLGAEEKVIDYKGINSWCSTDVPIYDIMVDDPDNMKKSPFQWDEEVNKKIKAWRGDITSLNVEAIVHSTNESMTDRNPISERLHFRAGIGLKQEIRNHVKSCRTGEAKLTKGYKLPARFIIHTVGPRYNIKYKTAAESALFNSYRNVLQIVKEQKIKTLAIPTIHSVKRGYPSFEGAHIAMRTVRRFLEKHGADLECVIFVVGSRDVDVYNSLLSLYFPRSKSEEDFAAYHLPYDVGNDDGEPVIAERRIRILSKPTFPGSDMGEVTEENISEVFNTSVAVGQHAFSRMDDDHDKQRRQKVHIARNKSTYAERQKRYDHWMIKSRSEDLSSIEQLRCLYHSGFDRNNRPVIVFVGKRFNCQTLSLEKCALHLIKTMDKIVSQPYVVVYFYTDTEKENTPTSSFITDIYNLVDIRYKQNLAAFYVVHPTFWTKIVTWFFTTFNMSDMKSKLKHIPGLEFLYARIAPDQLDLPEFVIAHDKQANGTSYYSVEEDHSIGSL